MLPIKEIITIDEEGTDLDRVVDLIMKAFLVWLTVVIGGKRELRHTTAEGVDAEVDAKATACSTQGESRPIAACQFL